MKRSTLKRADVLPFINCIPHGIALIDVAGNLLCMNDYLEVISGYKNQDVVGISARFVLRSSLPKKNNPIDKVALTREPAIVETDIISATRKKMPVRITVTPFAGGDTQSCVLCFIEDISFLKKLDEHYGGEIRSFGIRGHSKAIQDLLDFLPVLSRTDATLLITGETGTGKDLLAQAIHDGSDRAAYSFIKVNCGALPGALLESELFGHVRGAFTGAHTDKPGMFRLAQGGTLFLTEIGDLPLPLQVKLLTVLDDKEFFPLGSSKKVQVDVRVIAGTHWNLDNLIKEEKFREDLYFRLNVLRAHVPPLRDRQGDVKLLADYFLQKFAVELKKVIQGFTAPALSLLMDYSYPGNVRELSNIIECAANMCPEKKITPEYLSDNIRFPSLSSPSEKGTKVEKTDGEQILRRLSEDRNTIFADNWKGTEKNMIMETLLFCKGKKGAAAKELGWGRSTLWRKMKQHGIS